MDTAVERERECVRERERERERGRGVRRIDDIDQVPS